MRKLLIIMFFFIGIVQAQTTYYIATTGTDGAGVSGDITHPWLTLSYACTRVTTPTDTIYVNAGTYTETANCNVAVGVSIKGAGVTSHIDFTHAATDYTDASIRFVSVAEGTNGVQSISYLYLDGNSSASYHGILVKCRSNVLIHHCTIINFRYNAVHFNGKAGGYAYYTPPTTWSTGNQLYNCIITNCSNTPYNFNETGHGNIRITGQSGLLIHNNTLTQTGAAAGSNANIVDAIEGYNKGIKYYNNISYKPIANAGDWNFHWEDWYCLGGYEFYDNEFHDGDYAIDLGGAVKGAYTFGALIHNNLISLTAKVAFGGMNRVGIGLEGVTNSGIEDIKIYNNHFKNYPTGVQHNSTSGTEDCKRVYIYYNIFEEMGYNPTNYCATFVIKNALNTIMDSVFVLNNVIHSSTTGQTEGAFMFIPSGTINNFYVKNNIILNSFATTQVVNCQGFTGTFTNLYLYNNILYNNGSNGVYYGGGNTITNVYDVDNLHSDPLFVGGSPYDFSLQAGSPAIDAGIGVGLLKDYLNHVVDDTPDIGAYEYGATEEDPDPPDLPVVETASFASGWTAIWAVTGGSVTFTDGVSTSRGVCWSTSINPTIADSHTHDGTSIGTGAFVSTITGLKGNTSYYVRAYATNAAGTTYGACTGMTTPVFSTVRSRDGRFVMSRNGKRVMISR